jgi:hypothetical protein
LLHFFSLDSFTTNAVNRGGSVGAETLFQPSSVYADSLGVYIADNNNARVLLYSAGVLVSSSTTDASSVVSSTSLVVSTSTMLSTSATVAPETTSLITSTASISTTFAVVSTTSSLSTTPSTSTTLLTPTTVALLTSSTTPLVTNQTVTVQGNFSLPNGLTLLPGGFLNVTGVVTVSGPLVVIVNISSGSITVPVLQSEIIEGQFSAVSAVSSTAPSCSVVSASLVQSESSLSVVVAVDSSGCGLNSGQLAGIIVGCVLGATLIVIILGIILKKKRHENALMRVKGKLDSVEMK